MAAFLSLPWEQRLRPCYVLSGVLSYRQGFPSWPLFSATKFQGCLLGNNRYTNAKSRGLQERSSRRAVRAPQPPWAQTEGSERASVFSGAWRWEDAGEPGCSRLAESSYHLWTFAKRFVGFHGAGRSRSFPPLLCSRAG